jgi:hypothetical protein
MLLTAACSKKTIDVATKVSQSTEASRPSARGDDELAELGAGEVADRVQ